MPLGAHVSTSGGLSKAVERAQAIGAECFQVFLCAPQRWLEPRHADDEIERFQQRVQAANLGPNFAHAIYLINLASPDDALQQRGVDALASCLGWVQRSGLAGAIVHVGSAKGQSVEEAESRAVATLQQVLDRSPRNTALLLENAAGAGNTLGARFSQIGRLVRALGNDPRLGVCLDTAHAFASGYDLRTLEDLRRMLDEIDEHLGFDRLRAIHANDSKSPLASALDRHENIGQGHLGEETFQRLLAHPVLTPLPWLLEVPGYAGEGPDAPNVAALKRLAGRPDPDALALSSASTV